MKLAQLDFNKLEKVVAPKLAGTTIGSVISLLLPYIFTLAGLIMFFYLLYGGYRWMVSRGDPKEIQAAQQDITYAVIGFIVLFAAYWITRLFGLALGLQGITNIFK